LSPTPGACLKLWLTYEYEWSIGYIWRWSDWVERCIFIGLALVLGYTVFVVVRFSRRYYLARGEFCAFAANSIGASQRSHTTLIAELSRGVGTLKSIASAAPFLGLAGMDYGILAALFRGYTGSRGSLLALFSMEMAGALAATAAGLLVATPAAVSYNALRTLIETFESRCSSAVFDAASRSYGFAQHLPLQRRFSGLPPFALIGAPVLGMLVPFFALFQRFQIPMGLSVRPLKIAVSDHNSGAIIITVTGASVRSPSAVYVNSKETPWDELGHTLRSQLEVRPRWIVYVEGGEDVGWADVTKAIDVARGLHAEVMLLTATPNIDASLVRAAKRAKASMK
jgi:hypothetical protein